MTKPVTLSDGAFAALRREKKKGESDSDVVNRLLAEAHAARKKRDPWLFVRAIKHLKRTIPIEEHQRLLRQWRDDDDRDAWAEAEARNTPGGKAPARP
ncbi:MAG TPA: antitoxin VapB family protein [Candidatus Thermoplasmatota archaeon]|nr:antitoxin VapB family protein [Candidatus Thermoplasmatota archaeon]